MSAQRKATGPSRPSPGEQTSRKAPSPKKSWPKRILKWGLLAMLAGFLLGCAAFAYGYMSTD
ncbi:MAG: hypothetical protein ACXVWU_06060, partial [Nocardioides sp.]